MFSLDKYRACEKIPYGILLITFCSMFIDCNKTHTSLLTVLERNIHHRNYNRVTKAFSKTEPAQAFLWCTMYIQLHIQALVMQDAVEHASVWDLRIESYHRQLCVYHKSRWNVQPWAQDAALMQCPGLTSTLYDMVKWVSAFGLSNGNGECWQ